MIGSAHTQPSKAQKMNNPWIAGLVMYLIGCVATYLLNLLYGVMLWFAAILTGDFVMGKNISKLVPKDDIKGFKKVMSGCMWFFVFLSWVGLVLLLISIICQILILIFTSLKDLLNPLPEAARIFHYRLKNDAKMSPEAVWANLRSMAAVVSGSYPTKFEVIADLEETANNVPGFEVPKAISLLTEYGVLKYEWPSYRPE
jgi:hypothetical protein